VTKKSKITGPDDQITRSTHCPPQLGRRLFVFKAAAVLGGVAASSLSSSREALAEDPTIQKPTEPPKPIIRGGDQNTVDINPYDGKDHSDPKPN
jgi:hypothetical protein